MTRIAELPFHQRPVIELLNLEHVARRGVNRDYAGYGWAAVDRVWLGGSEAVPIDNALVLAVHSMDDSPALADDVTLEFELADRSVGVRASRFLEIWLPKLPRRSAIVLAMCNPHRAVLRASADVPIHYAMGDVEAWFDVDFPGSRIRLAAATWCTLAP